jgi:hypothetical protein
MPSDDDSIPDQVSDLLAAVVLDAPSRTVTMRIFVDQGLAEVLVTAPKASVDAGWANLSRPNPVKGESRPEAVVIGDLVLSRSPSGEKQSLLSIRRGAGT